MLPFLMRALIWVVSFRVMAPVYSIADLRTSLPPPLAGSVALRMG